GPRRAHVLRGCRRNGPWGPAGSQLGLLLRGPGGRAPGRLCALGREDLGNTFGLFERLLDVGDTRGRGARLAGTRDHLDEPPALRRAEGAALLDAHQISGFRVARL